MENYLAPVWAPNEASKLFKLVLAMCALAHMRRKEMRKRWLPKDVAEDDSLCHPIVDHPAFGYLWENGLCLGTAFLIDKYLPRVDVKRPAFSFMMLLVRGWIMVNGSLLLEKFAATYLYSHVRYFSKNKPRDDLKTLIMDYARCNLPVELINALVQLSIVFALPQAKLEKLLNPPPLNLGTMLLKFLYARICVDVSFGIIHRIMHENQWVYNNVHRTHHEHVTPRTQTNLHFSWLDQFLEAVAPIYITFGSLTLLGWDLTLFEQSYVAMTTLYYESCSHSGKEAPIVTFFPLLSPLVDWVTGSDQRLIEYHTRHHQLYRCNYSISPWWDKLMGTYRIDLPDQYDREGSIE